MRKSFQNGFKSAKNLLPITFPYNCLLIKYLQGNRFCNGSVIDLI